MKRAHKSAADGQRKPSGTQKVIPGGYRQLIASLRRAKAGFEQDRLREAAVYHQGSD